MGGSFQFKGLNYVTKIDATITYNKGAELITITLHVAEGEPLNVALTCRGRP